MSGSLQLLGFKGSNSSWIPYIGQSPQDAPPSALYLAGATPGQNLNYTFPLGNAVFVGPSGTDASGGTHGTQADPFLTIEYAITQVTNGQYIVILDGTFRPNRFVVPSTLSGITIQPFPQAKVIFDGSRAITSWTNNGNGTWSADYTPIPRFTYSGSAPSNLGDYPDQLWADTTWMTQIVDGGTPAGNQFSVNRTTNKITIGIDPATVTSWTVSDKKHACLISGPNTTIRGITMQKYSPENFGGESGFLYNAGSGTGMTLENCVFKFSSVALISLLRAGTTISHCNFEDAMQSAIQASKTDGLTIDMCILRRGNRGGWPSEPTMGALKVTSCDQVYITNNYVTDFPNGHGLWADVSVSRCYMIHNHIDGSGDGANMKDGIEFEESDGGFIGGVQYYSYCVDNTIENCNIGVLILASGYIKVWNNYIAGYTTGGICVHQDRNTNPGTDPIQRDPLIVPWLTVGIQICNNNITAGARLIYVYDDGPSTNMKGWDMLALLAGNWFNASSGNMTELGKLGGLRDAFNSQLALQNSTSIVGGPPGSKLETNAFGTSTPDPNTVAKGLPTDIANLVGATAGAKYIGPIREVVQAGS